MAKLFANSGDPDQMPHSVASDLGLHCLQITLLRVSRLQWIKKFWLKSLSYLGIRYDPVLPMCVMCSETLLGMHVKHYLFFINPKSNDSQHNSIIFEISATQFIFPNYIHTFFFFPSLGNEIPLGAIYYHI